MRQLDHRSVFGQTAQKKKNIFMYCFLTTQETFEAASLIPPAGHQQLVLAEGKSDLELLQQLEELRHVTRGETFGVRQELLHQRALDDAFGRLPKAAALQGQFLHGEQVRLRLKKLQTNAELQKTILIMDF